jgi:TonB family protein
MKKSTLISASILLSAIVTAQSESVNLGLVFLDSMEHHYSAPQLPEHFAHPKSGFQNFVDDFMSHTMNNPKYQESSTNAEITFTVFKNGKIGGFLLGDHVNINDTLFVTNLYQSEEWIPAFWDKKNQDQVFKLRIQSEDALIYTIVEEPAEFVGGKEELYKYIYENIEYTEEAKRRKIEGNIFVRFIVEIDGKLSHVEIVRGLGYGLDEIALELFENMPKWIPASQRGIKVKQIMIEKITFSIKQNTRKF